MSYAMQVFLLVLCATLAPISSDSTEIDQETINKLLKHVPEIPAIPTKNGYYIFVPSSKNKAYAGNQSPSSTQTHYNNPSTLPLVSSNVNINPSQILQSSPAPGTLNNWIGKPSTPELDWNIPITFESSEVNKLHIPQMRGVNRASFEYSCVQGNGIIEGPSDDASIQAMKKWNIKIVRLPLNEDCWLGINGVNSAFSGESYRSTVSNYVKLLRQNELSVILDLHWSDGAYTGAGNHCNDYMAKCQKPMPDAENAPKFWQSVARQFQDDPSVIFDLFSNPYPDKVIQNKNKAWKCWRNGGADCPEFQYTVAGMQDLVNAVRETGATNPIMVGGIKGANDMSKWEEYVPHDPENKIIAAWQSFKENQCNNEQCWESEVAPLAQNRPVIVGAIGESGCAHEYIDKLMDWLDEKKISYLGWTWNVWDCSSGPSLISDYNGTPTGFGKGMFNRLKNDAKEPCPESHLSGTDTSGSTTGSDSPEKKHEKQLKGVNRSGGEYSCVKNLGILEGPVDDNAVKTMKSWSISVVRIPLNEDCWLGINGHNAAYSGDNYRRAVTDYVNILKKNHLNVILDLHWTDGIYGGPGQGECYDQTAKCQKPMPDKENATRFWQSVAKQFKDDDSVIFDLFNEPFPDMVIQDKSAAWNCWRDGGNACPGFKYEVAGMQDLISAVRSTGAKNQVMVGGITWANDISRWLEYKPTDPANNMAASWHSYDFNACNNKDCWESQIAPVAIQYPVIAGEVGEHGCTHSYTDGLMDWLDRKGISYLGWTWNTWDCSFGPSLISNYDGTPTEFGKGLKKHLLK